MPLSSIATTNGAVNQANKHTSEAAAEQSSKSRPGLLTDYKNTTYSDNVTLTETGSSATAEKIAAPETLDAHGADSLLKKIMAEIMVDSKTAVSAQANLSPRFAQSLLAD